MDLLTYSLTLLSVWSIWSSYRWYRNRYCTRERRLRERVAYMLWVMANTARE